MKFLTALVMWIMTSSVVTAKPIEYFLPEGEMYDASIPSPEAVLGQPLGDRHLRHDQIISYLSVLAASRPEAKLIDYGRTNEGRRLVLLAISSADNISNLEQLKEQKDVLKIWNGFSIHGNESSGANASVLYAWYLLATNRSDIKNAMDKTVVLIDPSINPDGLARFTTYVNNKRSMTTVSDPNDIANQEHWPSGRTNHYWFDLNRDWLLLTQTESKARIKQFHQWHPHVLTDHHEMGSSASFFFQPGVPSRTNPLIPKTNLELTAALAEFHAKALDEVRQPYYQRESFDDFYPGKGSTYPDLHGSIGILFEQARAMGGVIDTDNGQRSLAAGIRNQFLTARSTFAGAQQNRQALLDYQQDFFENATQAAAKLSTKGYVLDLANRSHLANKLQDFLRLHQIQFSVLTADKTVDGHNYQKNQAIYIPLRQRQTTLIQSLFNTDTTFEDNTFYDVSAWHLGMAWGLPWAAVSNATSSADATLNTRPNNSYNKQAVAYVFDWQSGNAPAALNYLSQQQHTVSVSAKPLNIDGHQVPAGSFILAVDKNTSEDQLFATLSTITDAFQVQWYPLTTGLADSGIDLGSPNVELLQKPRVLMLVGAGVDAYQAGSIWHLFDTQVYLPLTKVRVSQLDEVKLSDYTHIIMPNGRYQQSLDEALTQSLQQWVKAGGHLIALQQAANWVEENLQAKADDDKKAKDQSKKAEAKEDEKPVRKAYANYQTDAAERVLGGAIVSATADLTHPLAFGTHLDTQYVLMKGRSVLNMPEANEGSIYNVPLQITEQVRAAGFVSDYWVEKLSQAPLVVAERSGQGSLIKFGFNPNFRAYWYGTQRWLINAIFQAQLINRTR